MKRYLIAVLLLAASLLVVSCRHRDNPVDYSSGDYFSNTPVTANVEDAYTYVVNASSFTYEQLQPIAFTTDSLTVAITVRNFSKGQGTIDLRDAGNNLLYSKTISSGLVSAEVIKLPGLAKKINLSFTRFSGQFTLSIAAVKSKY